MFLYISFISSTTYFTLPGTPMERSNIIAFIAHNKIIMYIDIAHWYYFLHPQISSQTVDSTEIKIS